MLRTSAFGALSRPASESARRVLVRLASLLGLTVEDIVEELLWSATKISRMETVAGRSSLLRDTRNLCELYDVDEITSKKFANLAFEACEQSWWTKYDQLKLDPHMGPKQDATSITCYSM